MEDRHEFAGQDVFMSLGLLNEVATLVGDPSRIGVVDFDPEVQAKVIDACLVKRSKMGKRLEEHANIDELDVSVDDVEQLLDWVKEHIMQFFMRRLTATAQLVDRNKEKMEALAQFINGSQKGASAISSSGPSA